MGNNKKKGNPTKGNVFKVAGAKSLKKTKSKAVNLGLKNDNPTRQRSTPLIKRYVRKPGSRPYINYTKETLRECIAAVKSKRLTQKEASEMYNVPQSTIKIKLVKPECQKPGRQLTFSEAEESMFVKHFMTLTRYGFPVTNFDIKMFIRDYLISQNRIVRIFRDNIPGKDWLNFFIERHKRLDNRLIKHKSPLTQAIVTEFIDNIANEIEDLPPENIYCYDEIGFCDDFRKYSVGKRGTKYPENNIQSSKPSFSAMFCGNAAGETLPPFVTYKSDHLSTAWTFNGPRGARYCSSKHGWIDIVTFEDWFLNHLLPVLKRRDGRKLLIGDNLSSHISIDVISECEENDIHFMCLPYNSSHILHPIDVAYFQPLRPTWKKLINEWKETHIGHRLQIVPKTEFPGLLKRALNVLIESGHNLITGFKNTGIYPTSPQEPFARLPRQERVVDMQLMKMRKMMMPRSICPTDDSLDFIQDIEEGPTFVEQLEYETPIEIKEEKPDLSSLATLEADLTNDAYLIIVKDGEVLQIPIEQNDGDNPLNICVGDHVIVSSRAVYCPGQVLTICNDGAFVYCMAKGKSFWTWPEATNTKLFTWDNILCKIEPPRFLRKGCFLVPEMTGIDDEDEDNKAADYSIEEDEEDDENDNDDDENDQENDESDREDEEMYHDSDEDDHDGDEIDHDGDASEHDDDDDESQQEDEENVNVEELEEDYAIEEDDS